MIKNLKQSVILTFFTVIIFGLGFPVSLWLIAQTVPEKSEGSPVYSEGKIIGFENIGQSFTDEKYFWGRPSAVGYNAASTGGSNKGPTNPDYLSEVQARIDTFLVNNPGVYKKDIPSELVTSSGGGLDPHITPQGALIQASRISKVRNISEDRIVNLVKENIEKPALGFLGTERVNVLKLNIAVDQLK